MSAPTDTAAVPVPLDADVPSGPSSRRPDTGGMTALADVTRERRGTGTPSLDDGVALATLPAARLEEIAGAVHAAADLVTRWREEAQQLRDGARWGLAGIREKLWADALDAAADDLVIVVEPARRVRRPADPAAAPPPPPPPLKAALLLAVSRVVNAHAELPLLRQTTRASRFPFEVAQAAVDVVAPPAYARGLARARGLLLDRGDVEAAHALAELEETR